MSQRLFYGFSLPILFISINLFSMPTPRLTKKLNYSINTDNKEQVVLYKAPSPTPYFEKQSIALQQNDVNQYPLIFNRNQHPCITQYLLGGKVVGKLIQMGDEINFTTDDYKVCNFSLQIPYQTGSLTIDTQGQCLFEKKINTHSAYITGKTIDFCDDFFSHNGLVIEADNCKNHAQLTCCDFLFKGKTFEIMPKSSLNMHNSLTLAAQSLITNKGVVDCKKETSITSLLFKNSGTFTSHNMHCNGHTINNEGIITINDTFHCNSKLFDHRGELNVSHNCIMEKGDVFCSTPSSVLNVKGDWKSTITSLYLNGSITAKNFYFIGKDFTAESSLHYIAENTYLKIQEDMINAGTIKSLELLDVDAKNINLEKTSHIMADNTNLKANQTIQNEGTVSVQHHLSAGAHYISNAGKIEANSSKIKADRYFYNKILSTFHAKNNLTIHTPLLFNLGGLTHAQSLTINSALALNALGIYAAKNMNFNSLVSINAGLLVPKFTTLAEIYSWQNIRGLGESLFSTVFPLYGIRYTALKTIFGIFQQGKTFCNKVGSLCKQKSLDINKAIALMYLVKNISSSTKQTYDLKKNHSLLSTFSDINQSEERTFLSTIATQSKNIVQQLPSTLMSLCAPKVNTNGIIDINQGIAIGINNHSSSLYNRNLHTSLYVNNTIDTCDGENRGKLGAYNLNIKATDSYNSSNTIDVCHGTIDAHSLKINKPIAAFTDVTLKGTYADINADISAKNLDMNFDNRIEISSDLTSVNTYLHAKNIKQNGTIIAQQACIDGDAIDNCGTIKAPKIIITKATLPDRSSWFSHNSPSYFHNKGSLQASEQLSVDAKDIYLNQESKIDTPCAYFHSDFNWQNNGHLETEYCFIDAHTKTTNNGTIQASELLQVKAQNAYLTNASDITTKNACFQIKSDIKPSLFSLQPNWQNDGKLKTEHCFIDAQKHAINNGTINTSESFQVKAQNAHLTKTSEIKAKSASFHITSNPAEPSYSSFTRLMPTWQNDGSLNIEQCFIEAPNQTLNNGTINATELLQVKTQNLHLTETSDVTTKNISIKIDGKLANSSSFTLNPDLRNDGKLKIEQGFIDAESPITNNGIIEASELLQVKAQNALLTTKSDIASKNASFLITSNTKPSSSAQKSNWQNNGNLKVENCFVDAQNQATNNGTINARESLQVNADNAHLTKTSDITAPNASFSLKSNWQNNGNLKVEKCFIDAQNQATNNGTINARESLQVNAQNAHLTTRSDITTPNASFSLKSNWQNNGNLNVERCFIDAQNHAINNGTINASEFLKIKAHDISFQQKSLVKAKDADYEADQNIDIDGKMNVERGTINAGGKVTAIGKLGASDKLGITAKDILITRNSDVSANQADLRATQTIHNQGNLRASHLLAHANYVTNLGTINSDNAHIKADRCFWNQPGGVINVENNLSIDALVLLNTLGYVSADSLYTNSIIDANLLGIYRGNNVCQNSFINFNKGILIPKFKSLDDLKNLVQKNPLRFAESFVLQFTPQLGKIYSLTKTVVMCLNKKTRDASILGQGISLVDDITALYHKKDLCVTDVLPTLCQTKNMLATVIQTGSQAYHLGQEAIETGQQGYHIAKQAYQEKELMPLIEQQASQAKQHVSNVTQQTYHTVQDFFKGKSEAMPTLNTTMAFIGSQIPIAAAIVGPQLSRNSLVDINDGFIFGVNGNSQSLYSTNSGVSLFANNNTINTLSGSNSGLIAGGNVSIDALNSYVSNGTTAAANISLSANDLIVAGETYAYNSASLKAHNNAVLDREIKARQVTVQAKNTLLKKNLSIDAKNVVIDTQTLQGKKGNTIHSTNGTSIKTNDMDNHGTIHGSTMLQFNGEVDQLKSIGSIDTLNYQGTLENNIADTLANGNNALLNVNKNGAVIINAQEQNVHLKEQHNIPHALSVQTNGSIECDKDLVSDKSIWLQAQGDIHHASVKSRETTALIGQNISSDGHITREYSGENYTDTADTSKVLGNKVIIHATENVNYKGTNVHSGVEGTTLFVGNRLIADDLVTEIYTQSEKIDAGKLSKETTTTKDKITSSIPCSFTSDGATVGEVKNVAELHGTLFASKKGTSIKGTIEDVPTYNTHVHQEETKQTGYYNGTTTSESLSQNLNPITFNDAEPTTISSDNPVSIHLAGSTPSITINAPHVEILTAQNATRSTYSEDGTYVWALERKVEEQSVDVTFGPSYKGTINTNAQTIVIEKAQNNAPIINTIHENARITNSLIEDIHQHQRISSHKPTRAACIVIAMAVAMATSGIGGSAGATMASAIGCKSGAATAMVTNMTASAISSLSVHATDALLNCNGDLTAAAKTIASTNTLKNIVFASVTAGAMGGAGEALNTIGLPAVRDGHNLGERLLYAAPRQVVNASIKTVANIVAGQDTKEAVIQNLRSATAGTIGTACTSQIGDAYGKEQIDPISHKLLHAGVGVIEGAILDGRNGAIAGGISALVAETVADVLAPEKPSLDGIKIIEAQLGRTLTKEEFTQAWHNQMSAYLKSTSSTADISKLAAASVALFTHQDVEITNTVSSTALDNNFLILAGYGIVAASVAYSAYEIHNTYQTDGAEAALKHLGIEVIKQVAFAGAVRFTFKFGSVIYPSAKLAVGAALESSPGLKFALGEIVEVLGLFGEKIGKSAIGQKVSIVENHLVNTTNKITQKISNTGNKIVNKVGEYVNPSFAEDLVEHVVPTKVLDKVAEQIAGKTAKESANTLAQTVASNSLPSAASTSVLQQEASLSMKEIAQQRLNLNYDKLKKFDADIENLAKNVSKNRVGKLLEKTPCHKISDLDTKTELFYNLMRETSADVDNIYKNTGISKEIINQIKQHVFVEEHILRDSIGRFFPDADMATAWNRLIENKYVYSDLKMLQHEYAESLIMQKKKITYDNAHSLVNKLYDWDSTL